MKFNRDHPDEMCGGTVEPPAHHSGRHGPYGCLRVMGHEGEHVAMVRGAELADGVCFYCRRPGPPHPAEECPALTPQGDS